MDAALTGKLKRLAEILEGYGQMLVALSGGVDSVFLLAFAHKLWGDDRVAALTANGPHFAPDEGTCARQLCETLGISHKFLSMDHVLPLIADNPPDRCYLCKKEIFSLLKERADMVGSVLADGTNLDDLSDYRPGYRALQELGIASPLKDAGLTKDDIRQALQEMASEDEALAAAFMIRMPETTCIDDIPQVASKSSTSQPAPATDSAGSDAIPIWEKPAFACLASRIPYGESITKEKLQAVYNAEIFLRSLGFHQVRVRHHGAAARIEVMPEDRISFFDTAFMDRVSEGIKTCGFQFAALDLDGYHMGSLNQTAQANMKTHKETTIDCNNGIDKKENT